MRGIGDLDAGIISIVSPEFPSAALLTGCSLNPDEMDFLWQKPYYAKLQVEIDTPRGVKSGASVIEVTWDKANKGFKVRGEAVAVDLPNGQTVFALLRSKSSVDWAAYLHTNVKLDGPIETHDELYRKVAADRRVWPVKRRAVTAISDVDNYPYFVRFKDIADPKSVEQVDPDNLAKSFGPGYTLKSLTVQMTGEPVTVGVEKRLGWLKLYPEPRVVSIPPGGTTDPSFGQKIAHGDFRKGAVK